MEQNKRLRDLRGDPPYLFRPEYFEHFLSDHRLHQMEAHQAILPANLGQIIAPCGTGKTRVQVSIHLHDMIEKTKNNQRGIFLIASHRLALNMQLIDPLIALCIQCGLPFDILFVGSGRPNFKYYYDQFYNLGYTPKVSRNFASINKDEIERFIKEAKQLNRHVIIVSTYHSIDNLKDVGTIDTCTCDEAHNTTSLEFTKNILSLKDNIQRLVFFTATRRVKGEDGGMNDESFYGKVLYDAFPSLMLERGEIVEPKIHIIDSEEEGETTNITDERMLVKNVLEAYTKHWFAVKWASKDPDSIAPKLLISFNGVQEMTRVYEDASFREFCNQNGINFYAISSEGGSYSNGQSVSRQKFMDDLDGLSDTEQAIIFNVDMLTEGIDLPSITGTMPMRNLSLTRLFQLFGRALRLHKDDRAALYNNFLAPNEKHKYIKPYGWLIVPRHLTTLDHWSEMESSVKRIWAEYKSPAEEMIIQERFVDPDHEQLGSMIPLLLNNKKEFELKHQTNDVVSSIILDEMRFKFCKDPYSALDEFLNEK